MAEEVTMRTHSEVCAFFEGLDMVEPGVAQLHRWRVGTDEQVPDASGDVPNYGGVGRSRGSRGVSGGGAAGSLGGLALAVGPGGEGVRQGGWPVRFVAGRVVYVRPR